MNLPNTLRFLKTYSLDNSKNLNLIISNNNSQANMKSLVLILIKIKTRWHREALNISKNKKVMI